MINKIFESYQIKNRLDEEQDMKHPVLQSEYDYVMNKENTGDLQKLMQQTKETDRPQKYNDNDDLIKILIKHFSVLQGWNTGIIFDIKIDNIIKQVCESKHYSIDIKKIREAIESEKRPVRNMVLGTLNLTRKKERETFLSSQDDDDDDEEIIKSSK